jgi:hypothetical protein
MNRRINNISFSIHQNYCKINMTSKKTLNIKDEYCIPKYDELFLNIRNIGKFVMVPY